MPSSHYGTGNGQKAQLKRRKKGKKGKKGGFGPSKPFKNQSHSFIIGTFQLGPNSIELSANESNKTDLLDLKREIAPFSHNNKRKGLFKGPKKHGKALERQRGRKIPALLYDTGSTDHIINNRQWFTDLTPGSKGLPTLCTGGGPVTPLGSGTAEFLVRAKQNKEYFTKLTFKNALYLP